MQCSMVFVSESQITSVAFPPFCAHVSITQF